MKRALWAALGALVLFCWMVLGVAVLAVMGVVSLVAGGWNVAGHPSRRPQERLVSGLLILSAVAVGAWWARRSDRRPARMEVRR
jgi:membrane protein implicated in regulation of membrane protease activity